MKTPTTLSPALITVTSVRIAYVEFYTPESVLMALAMSNQQIRGQTIMINASQAEKNRAAAANKYKKNDKSEIPSLGNTLAPRYQH